MHNIFFGQGFRKVYDDYCYEFKSEELKKLKIFFELGEKNSFV